MTGTELRYQSGFANEFATEAVPGALPKGQNSPQKVPLGLFAEHGRQVDLLITHLTLPTSSGIQVALLFRSTTPDLPVILTTGYPISAWSDRDSADVELLGSRSVAVLPKPFQVQTLWKAVRQLLGNCS